MLYQLGCLLYSPPLLSHIHQRKPIPSGHQWEHELRGASIWCVELIRRQIEQTHPEVIGADIAPEEEEDDGGVADESAEGENMEIVEKGEQKTGEEGEKKAQKKKVIGVNAILIDFLLYDVMKEKESEGEESVPHHRTRSIWY